MQVLYLRSVRIVFRRNAIARNIIHRMRVFRSTHLNQIVVETLTALKKVMVFQREPLLHLLHLLIKAIKVKEAGINLVLNTFLLIL